MNERTRLDRMLAAIPVAVVALIVLALYSWEASSRKTPTIFSDELEWAQLSRAIAATGHAAALGEPQPFKSLYAYAIAPAWWSSSVGTGYALIKYFDTVLMCLTAVPVYLLARMLVPKRVAVVAAFASILTSAMFYATFLLPEALAYPVFAAVAYLCVRSLAGGGRRWTIAAIVGCLVATQVRGELGAPSPAPMPSRRPSCSRRDQRASDLRARWSILDHAGAGDPRARRARRPEPARERPLPRVRGGHPGVQASHVEPRFSGGLSVAIGIGVLPAMVGLASLWLPSRRDDPAWRAFAAFTAAALVTVSAYTAAARREPQAPRSRPGGRRDRTGRARPGAAGARKRGRLPDRAPAGGADRAARRDAHRAARPAPGPPGVPCLAVGPRGGRGPGDLCGTRRGTRGVAHRRRAGHRAGGEQPSRCASPSRSTSPFPVSASPARTARRRWRRSRRSTPGSRAAPARSTPATCPPRAHHGSRWPQPSQPTAMITELRITTEIKHSYNVRNFRQDRMFRDDANLTAGLAARGSIAQMVDFDLLKWQRIAILDTSARLTRPVRDSPGSG